MMQQYQVLINYEVVMVCAPCGVDAGCDHGGRERRGAHILYVLTKVTSYKKNEDEFKKEEEEEEIK